MNSWIIFFVFSIHFSSYALSCESQLKPEEVNITHCVSMMNWTKTNSTDITDTFQSYPVDEINIVADRLKFYVVRNKKRNIDAIALREKIIQYSSNKDIFSNFNSFFGSQFINSHSELLLLEHNVFIKFFQNGMFLFLYYSDEGKIVGIQLINTNIAIYSSFIKINDICLSENKIILQCSDLFGKFFIIGEMGSELIDNRMAIVKHFNLISNRLYDYVVMKPSMGFAFLQSIIYLSNSLSKKFFEIFSNCKSIPQLEREFLFKHEQLFFFITPASLCLYTDNIIPQEIIKIISEYLYCATTFFADRMVWTKEDVILDKEKKDNNHEKEDSNVMKGDQIDLDTSYYSGSFDSERYILNVEQSSMDSIIDLKKQIYENQVNKLIFKSIYELLKCLNKSPDDGLFFNYQMIWIQRYNLLLLKFRETIFFMHTTSEGTINHIQRIEFPNKTRKIYWRINSITINENTIRLKCDDMSSFRKKFWKTFYFNGTISNLNVKNRWETFVTFMDDFNIFTSYLYKIFFYEDKPKIAAHQAFVFVPDDSGPEEIMHKVKITQLLDYAKKMFFCLPVLFYARTHFHHHSKIKKLIHAMMKNSCMKVIYHTCIPLLLANYLELTIKKRFKFTEKELDYVLFLLGNSVAFLYWYLVARSILGNKLSFQKGHEIRDLFCIFAPLNGLCFISIFFGGF